MELSRALDIVRSRREGVLATQRLDGRAQLSNIIYSADDDVIRISVTESRAKTRNLRRDPRASLHVLGDDFWHYVVIDADAELGPVTSRPEDDAADELVELYRALQGEHPDWADYRRAMVADRRLVLRLTPTHAYGMWG